MGNHIHQGGHDTYMISQAPPIVKTGGVYDMIGTRRLAWLLQAQLASAQLAYEMQRMELARSCRTMQALMLAESDDRECLMLLGEIRAIRGLMQPLGIKPDDDAADARQAREIRDHIRGRLTVSEMGRMSL